MPVTEPDAPRVGRDEAWFGELYRTWHGDVQRYARRRVPSHEVDDVVSEVFSIAWRRRDEVDEIGRLWLLGTAHHRVQHERRSGARRRRLLDTVAPLPPVAPASAEVVDVLAALQRLSPADREVLTLVAWEDLTSEEVAAVLGCTVVAARVRLHRARRRLAVLLDRPLPARVPRSLAGETT